MVKNGLAPVPLFNANGKQIFSHDFEKALQTIGIKKGDVLLIHSDLTVFGKLLLYNRNQLLETLVQVFKTCVGDKGSLIMPTFSYSFCKNEIFDVEKTKSTTGVLSEYFRKQPSTQRTIQPIQSCAVWGYDQKSLLLIDKDTFGEKSIFETLFKLKGKIVSPQFKDFKNGKLKIISFYAKKARGLMTRHLVENEVNDFDSILFFQKKGYSYSEVETTDKLKPVFIR